MTSIRFTLSIVLLLGILLFLQYRLWFESGGMRDLFTIRKSLALQKIKNENLKKRNEELLFQIQQLQNTKEETEARARSELGMIKKGEIFYQIVK